MDPSRARRVQGLPDPYKMPDSPDKKPLDLPKYIKRLHTYGTRRSRSNTDGKAPTGATADTLSSLATNASRVVESTSEDGETIVVDQVEIDSMERDNTSQDVVSEAEPGNHVLDGDSTSSVHEQESRATSHSMEEEQSEAGDGAASSQAVDEDGSVGNDIEEDEAVGDVPLNTDQAPNKTSETDEAPSENGVSNAPHNSQPPERDDTPDKELGKYLEKNGPLGEDAGKDVPVVANPQKEPKKQGKYRPRQKKHIINAIIGHRRGAQVNTNAVL
jgi:hypothetical protein